jgi:hypothetical protein
MKNFVAIAALILNLFASNAMADAVVGLHIGTKHFDTNQQWNDSNPGLYIKTEQGYTFGAYRNSEWNNSVYAGKTFTYKLSSSIEVGSTVGVLTGYKVGTMPFVLPSAAIKYDDYAVRIGYVPKINKQGAQGFHLMLEKHF